MISSERHDALFGFPCFLAQREDLQPTFTFFARCAANELAALRACDDTKQLVTASVGSRGHALAWAAGKMGMRLTVVMPSATPDTRREAVSRLGSTVRIHGDSIVECHEEAARMAAKEGYHVVGSHDNPHVIAAGGTAGLEIMRQHGHAHTLLRSQVAAADAVSAASSSSPPKRSVLGDLPLIRPELDAIFISVGGGACAVRLKCMHAGKARCLLEEQIMQALPLLTPLTHSAQSHVFQARCSPAARTRSRASRRIRGLSPSSQSPQTCCLARCSLVTGTRMLVASRQMPRASLSHRL